MMKKILMSTLGTLLMIVLSGCGDKEQTKEEGLKNSTSPVVTIVKYNELPVKKDLSYFATPKNIIGQYILHIRELAQRGFAEEQIEGYYKGAFNISHKYITAVAQASIDSDGISEFEIDEFKNKLEKEFKKSIDPIKESYKNTDRHIRIKNLNIPVKFSKYGKDGAMVTLNNINDVEKLYALHDCTSSSFLNKALENPNLTKYIIPSDQKRSYGAKIDLSQHSFEYAFEIKSEDALINEIGKKNKGEDIITEMTLRAFDLAPDGYITRFNVTSFKLSSNDKRFVVKNNRNVYSILDDNATVK
jgi:hypothetical protein